MAARRQFFIACNNVTNLTISCLPGTSAQAGSNSGRIKVRMLGFMVVACLSGTAVAGIGVLKDLNKARDHGYAPRSPATVSGKTFLLSGASELLVYDPVRSSLERTEVSAVPEPAPFSRFVRTFPGFSSGRVASRIMLEAQYPATALFLSDGTVSNSVKVTPELRSSAYVSTVVSAGSNALVHVSGHPEMGNETVFLLKSGETAMQPVFSGAYVSLRLRAYGDLVTLDTTESGLVKKSYVYREQGNSFSPVHDDGVAARGLAISELFPGHDGYAYAFTSPTSYLYRWSIHDGKFVNLADIEKASFHRVAPIKDATMLLASCRDTEQSLAYSCMFRDTGTKLERIGSLNAQYWNAEEYEQFLTDKFACYLLQRNEKLLWCGGNSGKEFRVAISEADSPAVIGGRLFMTVAGAAVSLFEFSETGEKIERGNVPVRALQARPFAMSGNDLLVEVETAENGKRLWVVSLTTGKSFELTYPSIGTGTAPPDSSPRKFVKLQSGRAAFLTGQPRWLWTTDGTDSGTYPLLANWTYFDYPSSSLTVANKKLFVAMFNREQDRDGVMMTDGTTLGTRLVFEIQDAHGRSRWTHSIAVHGNVLFTTVRGDGDALRVVRVNIETGESRSASIACTHLVDSAATESGFYVLCDNYQSRSNLWMIDDSMEAHEVNIPDGGSGPVMLHKLSGALVLIRDGRFFTVLLRGASEIQVLAGRYAVQCGGYLLVAHDGSDTGFISDGTVAGTFPLTARIALTAPRLVNCEEGRVSLLGMTDDIIPRAQSVIEVSSVGRVSELVWPLPASTSAVVPMPGASNYLAFSADLNFPFGTIVHRSHGGGDWQHLFTTDIRGLGQWPFDYTGLFQEALMLGNAILTSGTSTAHGMELVRMTSENSSPAISDTSSISLRVGHPVTLDVKGRFSDADGDPISFSVTGLPPGLTLNATQQISGRPALAGAYSVNFLLDDGVAKSAQTIQVVVKENNPPAQISTTPVSATTNQRIAIDLTRYFSDRDDDALTFSVAGLPSGLALQGSSISGAVGTEWSGNISVVAFDGYDRASGVIALTVTKPTPPPPEGGGGGGSAALLGLLAVLASQRRRNDKLRIFSRHQR